MTMAGRAASHIPGVVTRGHGSTRKKTRHASWLAPTRDEPRLAAWNAVARFDDYQAARRAVDRLSDDGSPVDRLDIVGSDLRLVERATCRMTRARATGPARCPA